MHVSLGAYLSTAKMGMSREYLTLQKLNFTPNQKVLVKQQILPSECLS